MRLNVAILKLFASASVDERDVAPEVADNIHGLLGTDKGYIRPELTRHFASKGVDLQTPLRRNIETVTGQLSDCFNIQKVHARDLWHLSHRLIRKILAYNFCFLLNKQLGNPPLQLQLLIKC